MNVLSVNCGSSTLKFDLLEGAEERGGPGSWRTLARGAIDRIGAHASVIEVMHGSSESFRQSLKVADHEDAMRRVLEWLRSVGLLRPGMLDAIGHRVVHGGYRFVEPTLIDGAVISGIEAISELAPLHNGPSLSAIRAARTELGDGIPMVAVFDTAFHSTIPELAFRYAIPRDVSERHHIRRYGFHGLAHRYMVERYADMTSAPIERVKLITLQLGNGCSATAIAGGRSVDTSMGFTPLEGLMMGTRSGDLDPSLVGFLARREGVDVEEVDSWLNSRSGLLGVSGSSRDMRDLLEAERQGDSRAALAIDMFCYRVRKYIGAYLAVLGGADAVVFGGGIGENAPSVRERICAGMDWCGLMLDAERNSATVGRQGRISADNARLHAYVVTVNEAVIIARDTAQCRGH